MQHYADIYLLQSHSTSGVLKTVTATSGTGHNTGTATSIQCGLQATEGSSCTSIMTCTGGCGYSF